MDWDEIKYFLAVAQSGNLSAAARRLGVSQPTVGRKIRQLESKLDARLFERVNHDHVLTSSGESILGLAESMERDIVLIERRVSGKDARLAGKVCLSTAECFGTFWLVPRLPRFWKRYPGIEVELKLSLNALDVMRGECDISMALGSPTSDELVGRRMGEVRFGLYAAPEYLAQRGEPRSLGGLSDHRVIAASGDIAMLPHAERLRQEAAGAEIQFLSNSQSALFSSVQIGLGLLALPVYMARGAPHLKRVLCEAFDLRLDVWLLTHQELRSSARIRAMLDFLAEQFRGEQPVHREPDHVPPPGALPAPISRIETHADKS